MDMRTMMRFGGAWAMVVLAAGAAFAQQAEPVKPPAKPPAKPSDTPSDKPSEKAGEKPADKPPARAEPTLDELLGLSKKPAASGKADEGKSGEGKAAEGKSGDATSTPQGTPKDSARAALDRQLASDQPVSDELVQAIALMRESEERLKASDAGAQTQRVQDETLKLLDKLIAQAKQNQQKQQQQKQQQSQQQQQSSERQQQQKQSSQQQGQQQAEAQAQQQGTGDGRGGNPASAQAQTRQLPQGAQAAWGNLPPHVRDALMQGASDAYSSTWEQLTGEYYKRLAEQDAAKGRSKP